MNHFLSRKYLGCSVLSKPTLLQCVHPSIFSAAMLCKSAACFVPASLSSSRRFCFHRLVQRKKLPNLSLVTNRPHRPFVRIFAEIRIDRQLYFEDSLKRQLEHEARAEEADRTCPLDCVREVHNYNEFEKILDTAEISNQLVMIDFYSSSCGACKYLLPQVIRLCKKDYSENENCSVDDERRIVYLKHNVRDEYDELTDLARFYAVRSVPMFMFFLNGSPVQRLFTRDKQRLQQIVSAFLDEI